MLIMQVPDLGLLRGHLDDYRLWTRWAEPEETGLDGPRIEVAMSTPRDEEMRTARVLGRAAPNNRKLGRLISQVLEIQGLTDIYFCAPEGLRTEFLHRLVCADLTRCSEGYGLSVDHFPKHYV